MVIEQKFGTDFVGDVPWGTHLCQFYETKHDSSDILMPYFAGGLRSNEACMWMLEPLEVERPRYGAGSLRSKRHGGHGAPCCDEVIGS
jgi:hypothetical protein